MAYTYHIYFFGLICHVGTNNAEKHYAAMVRDEDHTPYAIFDNDRNEYYEIKNSDHVAFQIGNAIAPTADARTTPEFRRQVPSLQHLMGGSVRLNIKNFAIPVHYPASMGNGSELGVADYYEHRAIFLRFGTRLWGPDCLPNLIHLTVVSPDQPLYVVNITRDYQKPTLGRPVAPDGCVVIANLSNHQQPHPGHFTKFSKILIGEDDRVSVLDPQQDCEFRKKDKYDVAACKWVADWLRGGAAPNDLECGNTGIP